jgi:spermidine/putrescine ABC transporter ATP-binding subunit
VDAILAVERVTKRFGQGPPAVDDVSLAVGRNEFFALLGPSGCGKTTLLRTIAGLETPTAGRIVIDGEEMTHVPANRRPVNLVFQSYALFPHMSVLENVGYGLMVVGRPKDEIRQRAMEALELVQLAPLAGRAPDQLSGGQRQRVALARALVKRPKVLLLDEPLSALDAKLREAMQLELVQLQRMLGFTFIIVTHDQNEALSIATRIAVMHDGTVSQIGTPRELYEAPASRLVAEFIGRINLLPARVTGRDGECLLCEVEGVGQVPVPAPGPVSGDVALAVRPERLTLGTEPPGRQETLGTVAIEGTIRDVAYFGDTSHVVVITPAGQRLLVNVPNDGRHGGTGIARGEQVRVSWASRDMLVLSE